MVIFRFFALDKNFRKRYKQADFRAKVFARWDGMQNFI